jgi:chromosome segregation ATPase
MGWRLSGLITAPVKAAVGRWLQPALLVALAAVSAWCFWTHYRLAAAQRDLASERQAWASASLRAIEQAHERERDMRQQRDTALANLEVTRGQISESERANTALVVRVDRLQGDVRAAVSDARGLRERLAAYAAAPPGDTAAACQARAGTLAAYAADLAAAAAEVGDSAVEIARAAGQAASERDGFAAEVVACVNGWPR